MMYEAVYEAGHVGAGKCVEMKAYIRARDMRDALRKAAAIPGRKGHTMLEGLVRLSVQNENLERRGLLPQS